MQALVPLHQSRTHKIRITVVAAEDLIKRTILSYPDPFAVTTVDGSQTQTTSAVKKTLNPHWNESFEFTVTDSSLVNVQVFDQRQFNTKDQGFLGSINVKISNVLDLERDVERQTKLNLQKSIENITVRGRIIIVLSANSSTRLNNSGSSQTQISGMSKRTDNSDLSASNTDRSIKSGLTAIKRTILKMSKPTPTTLTLDRRSTILLQAARRPSELEEKTISAYEDPGMDALRGGFGSVGSIIRARSMRNSIASRTGPASPAVEQWRQRHPYASEGDEPTNSNIFMPGVQRHQLYDAPVPRGSATSINTGGSRDDSISSRGKPRRVHKSIKFGNEDTRHFYPSLGLPGGVRHHSVKDNPHQQDAAYPPTSTGGDSVLSPQHMMSPEALRKQSKASNSFGDPALRVDTAGSTDNEVEEVPLTPSRSLHKLHPYSSDSAEDSEG
ncbi:hypothetical protein M408DRAFT_7736 [Serendipita vermifera MAFF 305830]|uniref:C2 domain-containing protein n=1 Tax=Serendipita vermifera MAFF 305830 TaxID=933852 RepID=A0A0C2WVL2_SERVB|nr:hypothetical protein M408DRAFT_7736 [Serendipita vermifera MAFF 305830]